MILDSETKAVELPERNLSQGRNFFASSCFVTRTLTID